LSAHHGGTRSAVRRLRPSVFVAILSLTLATALSVFPGQAAQAAVHTYVTPGKWAYTDSRDPRATFINKDRDAPIGAWRDGHGKVHRSRSYFTFDLAPFRGKRVLDATLVISETKVNDCRKKRALQVWRTDAITPSTSWAKPPKPIRKVASPEGPPGCPASYIEADVAAAVQDALAAGQNTLTLAVMVPAEKEKNVAYGRSIKKELGISVGANTPPGTPTAVTVNDQSCAGPGSRYVGDDYNDTVVIKTDIDDADSDTGGGDWLRSTFALWPEAAPAEKIQWEQDALPPGRLWGYVPKDALKENVPFVLTIRTTDPDGDTSPWSEECHFTFDRTHPDHAPGVVSTDYPREPAPPAGGPGIPGSFTFSSGGVADVAGYMYGNDGGYSYVAADKLGGSATVQVTPTRFGLNRLNVYSVDRAGNASPTTQYWFQVAYTAPSIEDADKDAWLGDPHTLTFRPSMKNVAKYTYTVDDTAPVTVAAKPDGTATLTVVPKREGTTVYVFSTTASGVQSETAWYDIRVATEPYVESRDFPMDGTQGIPVGDEGTFTFKPRMHGVVEYVYQFNRNQEDERPVQTVRARPDGTATVPYVAKSVGGNSIDVFARTADGAESAETGWAFYPRSIAPTISSERYPAGQEAGGPGVTGTFEFRPGTKDVESYAYEFSGESARTVAARPDGSATIEWTPQAYENQSGGWVTLTVRSHSTGGKVSDRGFYSIRVNPLAPTVVSDIYEWGKETGGVGKTGTFTMTAHLPASTDFLYRFDDEPERTVTVGPDGTAQFTWTPATPHSHSLTIRSRTASGLLSGPRYRSIWVPNG
jgi:hypothetical protein